MLNVLGLGYSETKIKPYLKMGVQRIQIANNKKTTSVKLQKREVANLLADKKDEKARIKVEHIIRDDFLIEAYELIELLCELLHERIRQITQSKDAPPQDLKETVYSLVWAAGNCDISELQDVKKHLIRKYGSDYFKVVDENPASVVNARLFNKLSYRPPGRVLVNRYLTEIADVYRIEWEAPIECEPLEENMPYSTPSGFSIAMAPGSGLASAYTSASPAPASASAAAPVATAANKTPSAPSAAAAATATASPLAVPARKLTPAEQEEYEQFRKHQSGSGKLLSGDVSPSPEEPVYPAVPGPPPHVKSSATASTAGSSSSQEGGKVVASADSAFGQLPTPPYAPSPSDSSPVASAAAAAASTSVPDAGPGSGEGEGVGSGAPPLPSEPAPAPAAPADPMEAMLARLAALK